MGRYSDDDGRRKKKKHRSRSRSISSESSRSSRHSKRRKSKKSKHKHRSRSRSKSSERSSHRSSRRHSRSPSYGNYQQTRSRSGSRSRPYRSRRSTSRSRRRSRSASRSRLRRSRSDSRSRYSSKRNRSRSRERSRRSSRSPHHKTSKSSSDKHISDPFADIPGFEDMTPAEQNKIRMQLALKAAAAADEKLKEIEASSTGAIGPPSASSLSYEEQQKRIQALDDIESEGFAPTTFKSSRSNPPPKSSHPTIDGSHDSAIFGSGFTVTQPTGIGGTKIAYKEHDQIAHPSLYVSMEDKMDKWCEKLAAFRRKKLEGEAMI